MDEAGVMRVAGWERWPWLRAGFTTRHGDHEGTPGQGSSNLGFNTGQPEEKVETNRLAAVRAVGGEGPWRLATVRQVHGTTVPGVKEGGGAGEGDGLVTGTAGVMLGILTADCVPLLVADVRRRVVGAFHAGWRGTAAGMAAAGVRAMAAAGGDARDMIAAVGPAMGPCCYEVGEEVLEAFRARFGEHVLRDRVIGRAVDLWEANRLELVRAGVRPERVTVLGECTGCAREQDGARRYFSHRAESGRAGRMMGLIGIVTGAACD